MQNLLDKIFKSITFWLILVTFSAFSVIGIVYANWENAKTTSNQSIYQSSIMSTNWNALVINIKGIMANRGECDAVCSQTANDAMMVVTDAAQGKGNLTVQGWHNFVDLIAQAVKNCSCYGTSCNGWTAAKNYQGLTKMNWNIVVDQVYLRCGSSCNSIYNLARIKTPNLTAANWNNTVELLYKTINGCGSVSSPTPTTTPVCVVDCSGKECGDDGCGGNCGICESGSVCENKQCVDSTSNSILSSSGNCNDHCAGLGGICNSIGTNVNGNDGYISSVTSDPKSGTESCSNITGTCSTVLGSHTSLCNGNKTDWTYCNCTICAENWNTACGQSMGDATCINLGTYNCYGSCTGASYKPAGTVCGTGSTCDGNGNCILCIAKCTDKECGSDGCGGTCGICNTGTTCDSTGKCIVAATSSASDMINSSGNCNDYCASKGGICKSVGTDTAGSNGYISSVTSDPKSGTESCSNVAGNCSTALGGHTSLCNGFVTDWTYCNCTICAANWKTSCGQEMGDATCINLGTYDCSGVCTGASYKAFGTSCGTGLICDGAGKCSAAPSALTKENNATGRSCTDICKNDAGNMKCTGVGNNTTNDNGLIKSITTDPKAGTTSCTDIAGTCDTVTTARSYACDGKPADWTTCKCSY